MRGKVILDTTYIRDAGITPAYAGKSRLPLPHPAKKKDHPRLCGEKLQLV